MSIPKKKLFGEGFGRLLFGWFPMKDMATRPLGTGDKKDANLAFWGNDGLDALDMGGLSGEGDAGADVDGVLEHVKTVVQKEFPERGGAFALVFLCHGEIKADK